MHIKYEGLCIDPSYIEHILEVKEASDEYYITEGHRDNDPTDMYYIKSDLLDNPGDCFDIYYKHFLNKFKDIPNFRTEGNYGGIMLKNYIADIDKELLRVTSDNDIENKYCYLSDVLWDNSPITVPKWLYRIKQLAPFIPDEYVLPAVIGLAHVMYFSNPHVDGYIEASSHIEQWCRCNTSIAHEALVHLWRSNLIFKAPPVLQYDRKPDAKFARRDVWLANIPMLMQMYDILYPNEPYIEDIRTNKAAEPVVPKEEFENYEPDFDY